MDDLESLSERGNSSESEIDTSPGQASVSYTNSSMSVGDKAGEVDLEMEWDLKSLSVTDLCLERLRERLL
jgi:hypothetical protein